MTIPLLYQEAISGETVVSKQGTPKIGCHATLKVKEFHLYSKYIMPKSAASKHKMKRVQENWLGQL